MRTSTNIKPTHRLASAVAIGLLALLTAAPGQSHTRHRHYRATRGSVSTSRGAFTMRDPEAFRESPIKVVPEVRGMWVVRNSITSPEQIDNVVETARHYGFNTLFVQVRGRGDAYYTSSLEPRAEELDKADPTFDPLAVTIEKAHAAGIQVHAWVNSCLVWSGTHPPRSPEHVVNAHPEWLAQDASGRAHTVAGAQCEGAFLSPANPDARKHIHDVFLDIVRKYDIDGIHFDYIRYPNSGYDYSDRTLKAFAANLTQNGVDTTGSDHGDRLFLVHEYPSLWADWRRQQVTTLVEDTSRDIKATKPWVVISAAVFADATDAFRERGQDWKRWLRDGALDAVIPMAYGSDTTKVAAQILDAETTARATGRVCYAGIGSWHISAESTYAKTVVARELGAQGIVLFSYGGVTKDGTSSAYLDNYCPAAFRNPAIQPRLSSIGKRPEVGMASAE